MNWFRRTSLSVLAAALFLSSCPALLAQSPSNSAETGNRVATTAELDPATFGHTFVSAPQDLKAVLGGSAPSSLAQLRAMELLQQEVAQRAKLCTVNVAIGAAQGSGVIVSSSGLVLTAAHVAMRPGLQAELTFHDGRTVKAEALGMNRYVDAGMLRIVDEPEDPAGWVHASVGASTDLRSGTWCIAAGHPGGFIKDRGVVVRVGRVLASDSDAIVTDCALIGGDSGGPLFDLSGRLIAIHSRIGNDVADNIHVPIDQFLTSKQRMMGGESWGYLPGFKPKIGVQGTKGSEFAEVTSVSSGSAAERAGLQPGDVILRFAGIEVSDFASLQHAVDTTMPGQRVGVVFKRGEEAIRTFLIVDRADP